jgi:hypothetical protein
VKPRGAVGRRLVLLGFLVLLAAEGWVHALLSEARAPALQRERAAYSGVLSAGEVVGATLLGGFRSIAINMVWIRLLKRLEEQRYPELSVLYSTLEVLQGGSPSLYIQESQQMVFDVPSHLAHRPEERWGWIRRGIDALERGRARFPGPALLRQAAQVYYLRFHPERFPRDRQRFLAESGRDPLELALSACSEALRIPDHPFDIDWLLWSILGRQGDRKGAERLLLHAEKAHGDQPGASALLEIWRRELERGPAGEGSR